MASCPKGLVNDPYPGSCGQYVDSDSNGLCDLSETTEVERIIPVDVGLEKKVDLVLPGLFLIPIILYVVTAKYKFWWNVALILSFIPTLISSVFYILKVFNPLLNNLHLYFGTMFVATACCHIIWHWRYFWGIIQKIKKSK